MKPVKHARPAPRALPAAIALLCGMAPWSLPAPLPAAALEEIVVTDRRPEAYTIEQSSLSMFTEALIDTPHSISVLYPGTPGQTATTDLAGVYHNLLRLWADA